VFPRIRWCFGEDPKVPVLSGRAYADAMREEIAKHIIEWRRAAKETNRNSVKTPFYFSLQITSFSFHNHRQRALSEASVGWV
jgi:hypothetical protein